MFTKGVTFLIQAAIVVAGVLAFSFFDPFNIFNTKKLRMSDTSLILESTKNIGELITAEFYGEVLVGSQESFEVNYESLVDSVKIVVNSVHSDFKTVLDNVKPGLIPNWKKLYGKFEDENSVLLKKAHFQEYWEILKTRTDQDQAHKVLKKAKNDDSWWDISPENIAKWYVNIRYSVDDEIKKRRRQRLVMLGRGWVRAGIDFTNFNENAFDYDRDKALIKLYGNKPRILNASINPWLSPEEGIPGWEIVEVNGKAKRKGGAELVKEVKTTGLNKLIRQAEASGILDKAINNAEVNLSGFFSLILDQEVKVRIYANTLEAYLEELGNELEQEEVIAASEVIQTHLDEVPEVFEFHKQVLELEQNFADSFETQILPLHYQAIALRLTENDILDETDTIQVQSLKGQEPNSLDLFYHIAQDSNLHTSVSEVLESWSWDELLKWYLGTESSVPNAIEQSEGWKEIEAHQESADLHKKREEWIEKLDKIVSKQKPAT